MSTASGQDWPDNAERFAVFARVAALLAQDALDLGWQPAVVHTHDWQTGLVAAFLADQPMRPKTVFTIHNLAYGGYFSAQRFRAPATAQPLVVGRRAWSSTAACRC